jgi:hypothetical protein
LLALDCPKSEILAFDDKMIAASELNTDDFPDDVRLSAADWPQNGRDPGDLQIFVPQGFGLGAPAVITPYGGPPQQGYYGFHEAQAHPFLNGPLTESACGTLYFDDNVSPETLQDTLGLMGVYQIHDYAAFGNSSNDSVNDRYLDQMRLVSHSAPASMFGATMTEPLPKQILHMPAAVCAFVSAQKLKRNDSSRLAGTAGGDGDWAKESLAFGFHVIPRRVFTQPGSSAAVWPKRVLGQRP